MKLYFNPRYVLPTLVLLLVEILIGIFVEDRIIRPYGGDVLVVILIYTFLRIWISADAMVLAFGVLIFSFIVELTQALGLVYWLGLGDYQLAVIIMGNSFAWLDLFAYFIGYLIIIIWEIKRVKLYFKY